VHGKTICPKSNQEEAVSGRIPDNIHRLHEFVVLTVDVMFVNGILFLTTLFSKNEAGNHQAITHAHRLTAE
jgi:hypothetical protein